MILLGYSSPIFEMLHHGQSDLNRKIKAIYVDSEFKKEETWEGYPLITDLSEVRNYDYLCGLFDPIANKRMSSIAESHGMKVTNDIFIVRHGIQSISKFCEIGPGCIIGDNISIYSNTKIGESCQVTYHQHFGHDCNIGKFNVFLGAYSSFNSNSNCGDYNVFGPGSIIKDRINIGDDCGISVGAVVTKDMPNESIAIGNPAKIRKKMLINRNRLWI